MGLLPDTIEVAGHEFKISRVQALRLGKTPHDCVIDYPCHKISISDRVPLDDAAEVLRAAQSEILDDLHLRRIPR